ncbi:MAG TPA: ABC transporter substrate-binding protein [bacterium]|nr:ABC transporter substrate-binding protein [bacterium]
MSTLRVMAAAATAVALVFGLFPSISPTGAAGFKNVISFGVNRAAEDLDPVTQDANPNIWAYMQIYQQLVRVNAAGDGFVPDLATSWKVSADGKTWTFALRPDAVFSTGEPVTSADVVWTFQRAHDVDGPWKWALDAMQTITAVNAHTVAITLKEPFAPFLSDVSLFSNSVGPASKFKSASHEEISNHPLGSGPYMLVDWKKGEQLTMQANPHYYGHGLPKTRELRIIYIPDDNTRAIALQSGRVDGVDYPPFSLLAALRGDPRIDVQLNPSTAVQHVELNVTKAPLNNAKFRQALSYATDRAAIVKAVLYGNGTAATSFLPITTPFFDKQLKAYTYDIAKAQALIKESGVATPVNLRVTIWSGNADQQSTATLLKDEWAKIGVNLEIEPLDRAAVTNRVRALDYQVAVGGWTNDVPDPSELASYEFDYVTAKSYHTGYQSAAMSALIKQGERELDQGKRRAIYYKMQELAIADAPLIWLYYAPYTDALNKNMHGFVQLATGPWIFTNVTVAQ